MNKKKKYLIGAGAAMILLVTLFMVVIMPLNQKKKFHECMQLGIHYIEELEYEQAIVAFTKAIELNPKNAVAYYGLAQACYGMADTIEGEARLTYLEKTIDAADKVLSLSVKSKEYVTLAAALKDKAEEERTKIEKEADEASETVSAAESGMEELEKETETVKLPVVEISDLVNEDEWTYTESGKKLSYYRFSLPRVTIRNFHEAERKINHYYEDIWEQAKNGKNELKEMGQDEFVIEQIETGGVSWYLDDETTYTVLCNDGKILSISRDYEGYWGGAHGGYSNTLESFDVAAGAKISLESISDREDEFRLFLVNWMEKEIQNSDRADMTFDGSLTTESIANYCLVKDGLKILYNAYDIASYAAGQFDFVIPYQECLPYLNEYGKGLVEAYIAADQENPATEPVQSRTYTANGKMLIGNITYETVGNVYRIDGTLCDTGYADKNYIAGLQPGDVVVVPSEDDYRISGFDGTGVVKRADPSIPQIELERGTVTYYFNDQNMAVIDSMGGEWPTFRIIQDHAALTIDENTIIEFQEYDFALKTLEDILRKMSEDADWVCEVEITGDHIDRIIDAPYNYAG